MMNMHTKFEVSSLSRYRDIWGSVGYDTFKLYHDTDTDTFSEKYHDTDRPTWHIYKKVSWYCNILNVSWYLILRCYFYKLTLYIAPETMLCGCYWVPRRNHLSDSMFEKRLLLKANRSQLEVVVTSREGKLWTQRPPTAASAASAWSVR